ncbi:hypothetical protein BDV12DRAFT_201293 [Aspergillus spectabilis]
MATTVPRHKNSSSELRNSDSNRLQPRTKRQKMGDTLQDNAATIQPYNSQKTDSQQIARKKSSPTQIQKQADGRNTENEQITQGRTKDKDEDSGLKLRLDLNLEIEIELKARIHGDLTLALL